MRPRFSLRMLIVATTFVSLTVAWIGRAAIDARRQAAVVIGLQNQGFRLEWEGGRRTATTLEWLDRTSLSRVVAATFTGGEVKELWALAELPRLRKVTVTNARVGGNLAPLRKLRELVTLDLSYTRWNHVLVCKDDLPNLRELNISGTDGMRLDSLGSELRWLRMKGCVQDDLRALATLTGLDLLDLSFGDIGDIEALSHLDIRFLDISSTHVCDLSPLERMHRLRHLDLTMTPVQDLTPLRNVALRSLNLSFTQVRDLRPIASTRSLRVVDISGTPVAPAQQPNSSLLGSECHLIVNRIAPRRRLGARLPPGFMTGPNR